MPITNGGYDKFVFFFLYFHRFNVFEIIKYKIVYLSKQSTLTAWKYTIDIEDELSHISHE